MFISAFAAFDNTEVFEHNNRNHAEEYCPAITDARELCNKGRYATFYLLSCLSLFSHRFVAKATDGYNFKIRIILNLSLKRFMCTSTVRSSVSESTPIYRP